MTGHSEVEIVLVEDNPSDVELISVDFEAFARAVSEVGLHWLLLNEQPR